LPPGLCGASLRYGGLFKNAVNALGGNTEFYQDDTTIEASS
jgi:hypothetical protein